MASARLRKTFHYPADSASDDEPEDLDETEQEATIASLRTHDTSNTQFYRRAFLPLPLLATLLYLPSLFFAVPRRQVLLAFLSVSSLLSTAWTLHYFPPRMRQRRSAAMGLRARSMYRLQYQAEGPIEEYLPWLNGGLCGVLAFIAVLEWRKGRVDAAWRSAVPGIIFVIVMSARRQMRPLDVDGLERLRYEYKGA